MVTIPPPRWEGIPPELQADFDQHMDLVRQYGAKPKPEQIDLLIGPITPSMIKAANDAYTHYKSMAKALQAALWDKAMTQRSRRPPSPR